MRTTARALFLVTSCALMPSLSTAQPTADTLGAAWEFDSQRHRYRVEVVATGFRVPFGMAFLPDGRLLVSDRVGLLSLLDVRTGATTRVQGTPSAAALADTVDGG